MIHVFGLHPLPAPIRVLVDLRLWDSFSSLLLLTRVYTVPFIPILDLLPWHLSPIS